MVIYSHREEHSPKNQRHKEGKIWHLLVAGCFSEASCTVWVPLLNFSSDRLAWAIIKWRKTNVLRHFICVLAIKASISYYQPKEHPYTQKLSLLPAYVRTGHVRTYAAIDPKHAYRRDKRKRQGTTAMVIPCLCSFPFTALHTLAAEPPVNKKRTRTLSYRESGSSTNCMVDGTGLEPVTSCTSSRCSTSWANRP